MTLEPMTISSALAETPSLQCKDRISLLLILGGTLQVAITDSTRLSQEIGGGRPSAKDLSQSC